MLEKWSIKLKLYPSSGNEFKKEIKFCTMKTKATNWDSIYCEAERYVRKEVANCPMLIEAFDWEVDAIE